MSKTHEQPVRIFEEDGVTTHGAPVQENVIEEEQVNISRAGARIRKSNRTFTVILFTLISASLLLVMYMGVNGYQSLVHNRNENASLRLLTTLITTNVHMNDEQNSVSEGVGPEGPALVLTEHLASGDCETRIYLYQGAIVSEYALASTKYSPATADKIVDAESFSFTLEGNLLKITTEKGTTQVCLRSSQGGPALVTSQTANPGATGATGEVVIQDSTSATPAATLQGQGGV
ncbi:MAG: DUF4860 domain-containing protein [Coriobacteriia bacterium]|nr:DUF4860 domain-containing protein [Coriobacteriia bacterium]